MKNLENNNDLLLSLEDEKHQEEKIYERISCAENMGDVEDAMEELVFLTEKSKNHRVFSKLQKCVDILGDGSKELSHRELVVDYVLNVFFPLLNSEEKAGEIILEKDFNNLANLLGATIISHKPEDSFKTKCGYAFMESVVYLNSNNISQNE